MYVRGYLQGSENGRVVTIDFPLTKFLTGSYMLGSQLGTFLILILFKQLLSDKIFLGQETI